MSITIITQDNQLVPFCGKCAIEAAYTYQTNEEEHLYTCSVCGQSELFNVYYPIPSVTMWTSTSMVTDSKISMLQTANTSLETEINELKQQVATLTNNVNYLMCELARMTPQNTQNGQNAPKK